MFAQFDTYTTCLECGGPVKGARFLTIRVNLKSIRSSSGLTWRATCCECGLPAAYNDSEPERLVPSPEAAEGIRVRQEKLRVAAERRKAA